MDLNQNNIYFKMHCFYNAKTEIYDRSLTDMRSKHDPTEAFIGVPGVRSASTQYARSLYEYCKKYIEAETDKPFSIDLWRKSVDLYHLSAQGWIDLYESLVENGEIEDVIFK